MDDNYLEGGLDSGLAKDLRRLQDAAFQDGVRHVLSTMKASLALKEAMMDEEGMVLDYKIQVMYEIDLLRKMIDWAERELKE